MALLERTRTTKALIYCKYHVPQLETPRSDESDHGRIIGANKESVELAGTQIRSHFPSVVGPGSRKDRKACKRGCSQAHHQRKERHTTSYRNRQPMQAQTRVTFCSKVDLNPPRQVTYRRLKSFTTSNRPDLRARAASRRRRDLPI